MFDALLAANPALAALDCAWLTAGYTRASARMWLRRDGSHTLRVVWRKREDGGSVTITHVFRGVDPT
jgi:hypothetical protein